MEDFVRDCGHQSGHFSATVSVAAGGSWSHDLRAQNLSACNLQITIPKAILKRQNALDRACVKITATMLVVGLVCH